MCLIVITMSLCHAHTQIVLKNPAYISLILILYMARTCSWQVSQSKNKGSAIFNIQSKKVKTSIYQKSLCPENVMMIQVFDLIKDSIKDCDTKRCEVIFKDGYWYTLHSCNSIHYFWWIVLGLIWIILWYCASYSFWEWFWWICLMPRVTVNHVFLLIGRKARWTVF